MAHPHKNMAALNKIFIGVIGAGQCSKEEEKQAELVGQTIAELDGILVCGGLGGVMKAAARGAKKKGGLTIGILPGDQKSAANQYIDIIIPTGIGEARNMQIIRTADAVVALPGKFGTLSEMAFCKKMNKPLVSLSNWDISEDIEKFKDPALAVKRAFKLVGKSE